MTSSTSPKILPKKRAKGAGFISIKTGIFRKYAIKSGIFQLNWRRFLWKTSHTIPGHLPSVGEQIPRDIPSI
jgi:hypothetical protein